MQAASWRTPDEILRRLETRRQVVGGISIWPHIPRCGRARPEAVRQGGAACAQDLETDRVGQVGLLSKPRTFPAFCDERRILTIAVCL
jgi:hypothetical protein